MIERDAAYPGSRDGTGPADVNVTELDDVHGYGPKEAGAVVAAAAPLVAVGMVVAPATTVGVMGVTIVTTTMGLAAAQGYDAARAAGNNGGK